MLSVGGATVSVGLGWVGVEDGTGEGSMVTLGVESATPGADSVRGLVLQPAKSRVNSRKMKMRCLLTSMYDFIA